MLSLLKKVTAFGFLAVLPLAFVVSSASAQGITLDGGKSRGSFEVGPGTTKAVVDLTKSGLYRFCASGDNAEPFIMHLDEGKTATLNAGECQSFRSTRIEVENTATSGVAQGNFIRRAL